MSKWENGWTRAEKFIAGILAVSATTVAFYGTITRYIFRKPPDWAEEIVIYLVTWPVFITASILAEERGHVAATLLILGCLLEVVSIMLITLPIILPVLNALGINLAHFGIVMTLNMEIAPITPPVGLNLYLISWVGKAPLAETIKGVTPYIFITTIQLALITYWPAYTLFLPNLIMGAR